MPIAAVLMSAAALAAANPACRVSSAPQTVAIVELYTSQGCSSCPPADRWLSQLPARYGATQALPLAFHVGYWDYIGWQDPFARREFGERQRALAQRSRSLSATVYTPEVFIGGREVGDWHLAASAARAIDAVNARTARAAIDLAVAPSGDGLQVSVRARPSGTAAGGPIGIQLALTQSGHQTAVTAGENRGSMLAEDHVVRAWVQSPLSSTGDAEQHIALPSDGPRRFAVVALAQDLRTGDFLQGVELPLAACLAAP
jgi:hypothetical protein